jgi:hypothetical protein
LDKQRSLGRLPDIINAVNGDEFSYHGGAYFNSKKPHEGAF